MRAVAAGNVQVATAQVAFPLVGAGEARALLITTSQPCLNVPTLAESKVEGLEGLEPFIFFG